MDKSGKFKVTQDMSLIIRLNFKIKEWLDELKRILITVESKNSWLFVENT